MVQFQANQTNCRKVASFGNYEFLVLSSGAPINIKSGEGCPALILYGRSIGTEGGINSHKTGTAQTPSQIFDEYWISFIRMDLHINLKIAPTHYCMWHFISLCYNAHHVLRQPTSTGCRFSYFRHYWSWYCYCYWYWYWSAKPLYDEGGALVQILCQKSPQSHV